MDTMKLGGGKLFVLTAGMLSENTPSHEVAARLAQEERNGIFFVGYTDPDTPGGRLRAAKPGETFMFSAQAGEITRRCDVLDFDLTAHANRDELLDFVAVVEPHTVVLGHGEKDSLQWFDDQIRARYPKMKVIQATPGLHIDAPAA